MKKPGNAGGAKARQEGGCVESMTKQEELSKVEETPKYSGSKYTNVFLGGGFQFVHELVQVVTSKFPLKRLSNGGVMLLKAQKPFFEGKGSRSG